METRRWTAVSGGDDDDEHDECEFDSVNCDGDGVDPVGN